MKRMTKVLAVLCLSALVFILPMNAFAAAIQPADAAIYVTGEAEIEGNAKIQGDVIIAGGELESAGNIDGIVYQAKGAEINAGGVQVEKYDGELVEYKAPSFDTEPDDSLFEGRYTDGEKDFKIVKSPKRDGEFKDGYILSENVYVDSLVVEKGLTLNISAEKGELRVIRVETLVCAGNIRVVGDGSVVLYVDEVENSSHAAINKDGDPFALSIVFMSEIDLSIDTIYAEIYAAEEIKLTNTQVYGNIYAKDDAEFSGNSVVNGLVYAPEQEVEMSGNAIINGMVIAEDLDMTGNSQINKAETSIPGGTTEDTKPGNENEDKTEENPGENSSGIVDAIKVVKYVVATDEYTSGRISYMKHTPNGHEDLVYDVLNEGSFVPTGEVVPEEVKADIQLIRDTTTDVFEMRKKEVSLFPFGRVDSNAYQYALTISPYVVPILNRERFNSDVNNWLVMGDRHGNVVEVYMIVA